MCTVYYCWAQCKWSLNSIAKKKASTKITFFGKETKRWHEELEMNESSKDIIFTGYRIVCTEFDELDGNELEIIMKKKKEEKQRKTKIHKSRNVHNKNWKKMGKILQFTNRKLLLRVCFFLYYWPHMPKKIHMYVVYGFCSHWVSFRGLFIISIREIRNKNGKRQQNVHVHTGNVHVLEVQPAQRDKTDCEHKSCFSFSTAN